MIPVPKKAGIFLPVTQSQAVSPVALKVQAGTATVIAGHIVAVGVTAADIADLHVS